jgi:diguanylate cyclase (GGDEF)-like protein/PAS domain S-box-containing protein
MQRVLTCLTTEHDRGLLALAILVCVLGIATAIGLVGARAEAEPGRGLRARRLLPAAAVLGGGIWTTHFIAILAYDSGLPIAFEPWLTLLSAVIAGLAALLALTAWLKARTPVLRCGAGIILGVGIGAMHYAGMAALRLPGYLSYEANLTAASVLLSSVVFAAGFALRPASLRRRLPQVSILAFGVVVLHFTGMGAVSVTPDTAVMSEAMLLGRGLLAGLITGIAGMVLLAAIMVALLEARLKLEAQHFEGLRLRSLADASFEGLVLCTPEGRISEVNSRAVALSGYGREQLIGRMAQDLVDAGPDGMPAAATATEVRRATLMAAREALPVELTIAAIDTADGPRRVIAIRDLRERLRQEERIIYLAHHDPLTGLANRTVLQDRLAEAVAAGRRSGETLALFCMDLDRFKAINDMFGHAAGDAVLREAARRLLATVRSLDTVARVGGDEFVILQRGVDGVASAEALARRIMAAFDGPIEAAGQQVRTAASLGIAMFPGDAAEPEVLLGNADLALYRAKHRGRGTFAFFHPEMDAEARRRRDLERDLAHALERDQFSLHWQPQADAQSGIIRGFEALLRWRHPLRGAISPVEFIPVAEATGAIIPIGAWVLRTACAEAAGWDAPLRVAVNISVAQIQQDGFERLVEETLAATGLDPGRLELEVTESLFIDDPERALETLTRVKALGVRVAIDDFGTGFSSLSTLRAFAFDRIKIDRSFVSEIEKSDAAAAIVRAVIGLGQGLGLPVVAEGVETEAQLAALNAQDCDEVQGYFISRPMPMGAFNEQVFPARPVQAA